MQERNNSIDILKLILIVMLVSGHLMPTKFEPEYQTFLITIYHGVARVIVPLFFIMSGYFINNKINDINKLKGAFLRYFKLFLVWQLIYYPMLHTFFKNNAFTLETYTLSLIYGFAHLWYLHALSFGIILVYMTRNKSFKFKLLLALNILFIGYFIQTLFETNQLKGIYLTIYNYIGTSRNFFFFAFPYLLLGTIINQINLKNVKFMFYFLIICMIIEAFIYKHFKISYSNIFLMGIPLGLYAFKFTLLSKNNLNLKINPKMLLGMYLIHFYPIYYVTLNYPSPTFGALLIKIAIVLPVTFILFQILYLLDKRLKILF